MVSSVTPSAAGTPAAAGTPETAGTTIKPARTSVAAEGTLITVMPLIVESPETLVSRLTVRPENNVKIVKIKFFWFYWPFCDI